MLDWFLNLFTLEGLAHFLIGVAAASLYHLAKAYVQNRVVVFKWQYVTVPFALMIVMYIAAQTQQNADCVREFNQVLRERSAVTSENDRISIYQRELVYQWMHHLIFPPPDIAKLDINDPVRQQWAVQLTVETDKKFSASIAEQRENEAKRAANPLPPPTCGRDIR